MDRPPRHPAGFEKASKKAKQRWQDDSFATQVYHYEDFNLIWDCAPQPPTRGRMSQALLDTAWEENFLYIGPGDSKVGLGPSTWANTYATGKKGDKNLESFRSYLRDDPGMRATLLSLAGLHLVCPECGPKDRCHGDVIIE
eukprot:3552817-Heterocapsa_arctica.AAC.1